MDMPSIRDEWGRGKAWIDNFIINFPQLEELADGGALSNQKNAPRVGSVTLANAVRQIPRNSVQQLPVLSCEVNGTKLSLDAIVATYLLRSVVFNEDTFGAGILTTMQMAAQQALTVGFVGLRANVGKTFNKFATSLETLHYNDIVIEPGVFDAANSQYFHVRTRVTKGALKQLIADAKAQEKTAWNVPALERLLAAGPQTFNYNQWLPSTKQNPSLGSEDQYDIVTRYGVGPYYSIDVYSPQLAETTEDKLMGIKSKSKFGYPRVNLLVIDQAQLSPFGIPRAKLAAPMNNYGNIFLQSTAKMQLLNADPPVFKRGLFTSATPLRRGVTWESVDPNADVKLVELSNSTLQQFETVMGYIDNNILSVMGVSPAAPQQGGAYQNSATVQGQQKNEQLTSNQVTSIIENAIRQYGLVGLDLYISEQVGTSALIVDDEAKDAINQLMPPEIDPMTGQPGAPFVGDDNVVNVDWKQFYDRIHTWTVDVELSITPDQMADKKRADLQDTFVTMKQNAQGDPTAAAQANALASELIQDVAPEVSKQLQNQPPMPEMIPAAGGAPVAPPVGQ